MTNEHDQRWDGLALGHVLGGLSDADATEFRGHLVACPTCRARVAELRSMAADLASAEREERAVQRLRTEARPQQELDDEPEPAGRPRWLVLGVVALTVLVVSGLALWNIHLRTREAQLTVVAEAHERAVDVLAHGTVVPADTVAGTTGVVGVDGDRVAYVLGGLPELDAGERLVVWIDDGEGLLPRDVVMPSRVSEGRLVGWLDRPGARELVVTVEPARVPRAPSTEPLLTARLSP